MSGPGQLPPHSNHQHPHQQHRSPPPPPHSGHAARHSPPPAHGWIDASGRWQPGEPSPPSSPKKSSNGIVVAVAIIAGLLGLGVVGLALAPSDDASSTEDEALAELSERLDERGDDFGAINRLSDELNADETLDLNAFESRCVATDLVADLGPDRSLEITAADVDAGLPQAEAEALADAFVGCIDLCALFGRAIESDPASAGPPDFYIDCLFDEIGEAAFHAEFVAEFSGRPAPEQELEQLGADAGDRCIASFTPEQLDELANS